MPTVLVRGLTEEGPGDIVGAFAGKADVDPAEVAMISPYDDQVTRIEDELAARERHDDALEVDTVDGFQGREKEVVLVSLVRSNDRGDVGFLEEARRFNVALTRARRKAVVVGDSETVTEVDVLDEFVAYARTRGAAVEASDATSHPTQ